VPPFTLIGATTRIGLLTAQMRSRFGIATHIDFYTPEALHEILVQNVKLMALVGDDEAFWEIARRSRGTPRIANRLLRRVRDYAEVNNLLKIDEKAALATLEMLEIDALGLEPTDRQLLSAIIDKFHGGPVGIQTLAAALNDDRGIIEDVYEPYLMSIGLLHRTPSGRIATPEAYQHLGYRTSEDGML
jgi:Holliday junction DNA helicase RuvB